MIKFKRMLRRSFQIRALVYYLAVAMCVITSLPGRGEAVQSGVPTAQSFEAQALPADYDREADVALIMTVLHTPNGKVAMKQVGVSPDQMEAYLAQLTDEQVNLVASKIKAQIPPGGNAESVFWSLLAILLILFIVFLILDLTGVYKLPFRRGA